jgi:DAACS family dicarboxylate/amino acid:cation (Na+ or H+) symporter
VSWPKLPLVARVLIGVALGAIAGVLFGRGEIVLGLTTNDLGALGLLVVRLLRMLAVPLVLFAVLDAIARTDVSGRMGLRLVVICLVNVSVAFAIGLTLMNAIEPGAAWQGRLAELTGQDLTGPKRPPADATLSPLTNLDKLVPESAIQPFVENNIITVVLFAVLVGAAIRKLRKSEEAAPSIERVVGFIEGAYRIVMQMLSWVIEIVPYAVFGVVAQVVGKAGFAAFSALWGFLGVILLGMAIHAFVYYPLVAWWVGRVSPRVYIGRGATAFVTGLSTNSSLATMPVTLRTLESMGVSTESARMSACVGTNLNNDGITLYEAMAALFLAQALGYELALGDQMTIVAASLMAGIGVAGIPEAGMVVLPLVLAAAGLPDVAVAALLPVVFTVDWILARCRTIVNVMADMLVAILLDRWAERDRRREGS